jgi:hypothetical protein
MRLEPLYTVTFTTPEARTLRSSQTPESKDAVSCWPRSAPPGASRPATARPTSLGSEPTRHLCPSSEGCSRPTTVPRSCSSGRGWRCSPTLVCDGCSAARAHDRRPPLPLAERPRLCGRGGGPPTFRGIWIRRCVRGLRDGVGRGGTSEECFRVIRSTLDDEPCLRTLKAPVRSFPYELPAGTAAVHWL